jgi:IS5 family transposase
VSTMTKVREKRFISRLKDRDNERRLLTADARNQMLVMKSACMGVRAGPRLARARRCFQVRAFDPCMGEGPVRSAQ